MKELFQINLSQGIECLKIGKSLLTSSNSFNHLHWYSLMMLRMHRLLITTRRFLCRW